MVDESEKQMVFLRLLVALLASIIAVKSDRKVSFLWVKVMSQAVRQGSAEIHFDAIEMSACLNAESSEMCS